MRRQAKSCEPQVAPFTQRSALSPSTTLVRVRPVRAASSAAPNGRQRPPEIGVDSLRANLHVHPRVPPLGPPLEQDRTRAIPRRTGPLVASRRAVFETSPVQTPPSADPVVTSTQSKLPARATSTASASVEERWTFDAVSQEYVVQCPHCQQPHLIPLKQLNCCEFACGADARTGQPLRPHITKGEVEKLLSQQRVVGGCGGRFKFNPRRNQLEKL
mmetsp:Transcript_49235/g.130390  ORF Transcript_49235/g.130390 Transcript_49235/m.130390 type:complete len:216 (-) Transcript_49235:273-920(-)